MPPKTLTAEQVAEIDGRQQKPVNWSAVVPQKEDALTARVNREAARQGAPAMLTAEQTDAAEAQNSVAAETSFGRAMGARPDRSVGPQVPAPKKVLSAAEVDQADYERVGNISYLPTKDEWKRYGQLRQRRDSNVGKFLEAGQAIAGGLFQAVAATAYAPFDFVARGTNAYDEWVNSSAEGMRQASISTAELWSWAGDVYDDNQRELQRNRSLNDQVRQRLALENRFTGNPQQDDAILKESISQAKAQGLYEKTPNDLSEDEDTQYQRFIRDRSFQQQAANVTETNIGTLPDDRAEMGIDESKLNEGLVLGSAMVLDPLNVVVPAGLGAANKVRLLRRVGSLAGTPLKGASKVAGYMAGKAEAGYGRIVEGIESATGLTGSQQMSALSNVSFKAAAAMAALKKSGAVLRATERGLRTGSILAREIGIGGVGASRVEAASKLRSAPIPERYRRAYDGFFTSADSTLRRVSETQGLSPIARRSAATLDKLGATQVFRAADDAVSGAAATAPIAVPLAVIAPEERRPEILGSILTIGAGAGLISGKPSRAADFDDALVAKMLADAEISGGDATSMANMIPHDRLVNMARGQSVISSKADFIPLRATDYELNATVKEAMGLGTRGIYVDAKKGQRPRIFVNLDKMASGDVAGHEIGHAIFKSDILGGEIKRGMRAMTDQQYGTDGVAARGREYVAAMLTQEVRDGATGIQLNVLKPDEVTRIAQARGDEAAERALTDEFVRERWANDADWRQQAIDERADMLNQESLGRGDTSWDWARDEIAAETFSGLGKGLNLSGIRASGPLSRAVGAASAAFEAMGARMRGNGRLETPNRLFVENPLFDTPEMRKAVNDYVKTFDRYLVGLEKEGAVKQRGTPIAPTGKASDAIRSPHTRLHKNGNVVENDLFFQRPDGTVVPKSQQQINTQDKSRAATIKSINDRTKFVNENSNEWGARKLSNGRVEVGGPNLPPQFDYFIQIPEYHRKLVREFEAGRAEGRSYLYSINVIGSRDSGTYKVTNYGNIEAKTGEMVPFGAAVSTKNHVLIKAIDLNSFRASAIRAIDNEQLGEFGNDVRAVEAGLKQLLRNYEDGVAGETGLGVTRKNILNGLLGTGTVMQRQSNPAWHTLNNQGSVRTFRLDRINYADPYGTGYFPHYNKININALPDDAGRMSLDQYGQFDADRKAVWMNKEAVKRGFSNATNWQNADAQGFQAADGQYRQQFPAGGAAQRGSAMPDSEPANASPFYMKSTQVLDSKIQGKAATVEQVRAILTNPQNGIKAEELKWTGVLQAAEGLAKDNNGKVPKDALLQYLADDGAVRLEEVTMGGVRKQWTQADINALERQAQRTRDFSEYERAVLEYEDQQLGSDANDTGNQTRFGQYQLAGGENYREVVLAMPVRDLGYTFAEDNSGRAPQSGKWVIKNKDDKTIAFGFANKAAAMKEAQRLGGRGQPDIYTSTHFPDTPNYVAHMRLNERTDAAGKRGLFLEEIQSDRHQAGREKGYKEDANPERDLLNKRYNDAVAKRNAARNALEASTDTGDVREATDRSLIQAFQNAQMNMEQAAGERRRSEAGSIPDAPFRKDWPMQMFKRALADAVGSGKEWIGWTTGETQAARYDLSKQIDQLQYSKNDERLWATKDGQIVLTEKISEDKIADYVGKEPAKRLLESKTKPFQDGSGNTYQEISGIDLKVGGEGMKGFYDQILPKEISKYVKQWGGQVEKSRIKPTSNKRVSDMSGAELVQYIERPNETTPIWRVNITPEMRGSIRKTGQAMFLPDNEPRTLRDMPQSALKVLHADSDVLPKPSKKIANATVALTLADIAEKHNGGIITSSNITPEQKLDLMQIGADEAQAALKASGKNAGNWYSTAIQAALGVAGVIYRELSDVVTARKHAVLAKEADPVRAGQFALRLPLAITSQNMTVKLNTRASNEQFKIFLNTGRFDPSIAYGEKAKSISGNLDLANVMIDELGSVLALEDFVSRTFTVRELEAEASRIAGRKITIAGRKDDIVNGAAIFGPKIGQGFLQNLMGKFDPVTIDLWMRRTWGRWTGDVVGDGVTAQRLGRLIEESRKAGRKLPDSIKRLRTTMRSMGETKTGKAKKPELTVSEDVEARLEQDSAFRKDVEAFAKQANAEFQALYRMMSDVMSPALSKKVQEAIARAEKLPDQANAILSDVYSAVIREQTKVKAQLDKGWDAMSLDKKKELNAQRSPELAKLKGDDRAAFIKKSKPIAKGDWLEAQHQAAGRTAKLDNPQKNAIKPAWANAAKSIVSELNPIDIPSDMDRRVITEVVNGIREELERRGLNVTNADVQAILWYPEKDLWAKLRGEEESILKQSYDDEFISIAEGLGLGQEARQIAKQIRGY